MTTVNDIHTPSGVNDGKPGPLTLEHIVGDLPAFEADVLHRTPHVRILEAAPVGQLLSLDDVDYLVTATGLRAPFLILVQDDELIPSDQYCRRIRIGPTHVPDLIHPGRVFEHVTSGATLILQGMQRYWPPLTDLCRQVESRWGFACHANAYLTPPGAQGFAEHEDSHDTLIVQVDGTKLWTLAQSPTGDACDVRERNGQWTFPLSNPAALYIPAGTRHAGHTAGQASLHVTIGMTPWTWERAARTALEQALTKLDLSSHLPTGALVGQANFSKDVMDLTATLAETIRSLPPEEIVGAMTAEFIDKAPPLLSGHLTNSLQEIDVSDSTHVVRRPGTLATVIPSAGSTVLVLGDRRVKFPATMDAVLKHILTSNEFHVGELAPFLGVTERISLVQQLIHAGLLTLTSVPQAHVDGVGKSEV